MSLTKQGAYSWRFECMVHGKRFSKTYRTYDETKSEVQKKFLLWKIECGRRMCSNSQYTFREFADIWLKEYCREYSPIVVRCYKRNLDNWILPRLGDYKLCDINPVVLDTFVNELKSSKTKYEHRKNSQLSNGTISKIFAIVRTILGVAYRKDLIDKNPCEKVRLMLRKPIGEEQHHFWDVETYHRALELLEKEKLDNALVVEFAIKTGLRRSEIWGLTWEDIDFEDYTLSVNKTLQKVNGVMQELPCKTMSSIRKISIPSSLLEKLKTYKEKHKENKHIFENIDYDAATQWFKEWQPRNNIPRIKFHDLRHSHATLLLYKGIDIKTISERLGHANISTTMNTYTHVLDELDRKCATAIDEI